MALLQYLEEGQFSTNLETGDYKVIVIGPGGDGGKGGTSIGSNLSTASRVDGAAGGGGGGGAYVYVNTFYNVPAGELHIIIRETDTTLFGPILITIPKAGSGNTIGDNSNVPAQPGDSIGEQGFIGSHGGGAGGNFGIKVTSGDFPEVTPIRGGQGSHGNGEDSTIGTITDTVQAGGKGGKGGANPRLAAGSGGFGASANGVHITEQNFLQITAEYLAEKITGGNGSNGTAPASRQAVTGISGGNGGGGGGAWTNGKDGAKAIAPGRGVNGKGGNGGIGGLGAVWLMKLKNNTTKTH